MWTRSYLTQAALAKRWKVSPRTLERWRWLGRGPQYMKVGGKVRYRRRISRPTRRRSSGRPAIPANSKSAAPLRLVRA